MTSPQIIVLQGTDHPSSSDLNLHVPYKYQVASISALLSQTEVDGSI